MSLNNFIFDLKELNRNVSLHFEKLYGNCAYKIGYMQNISYSTVKN